ncbi:MAG: arsenate reductase family protein [Flavobacteriaceae bacterium]
MNLFYYLSSCDTCKRIMKSLNLSDDVTLIDLKKNPLTSSQLDDLYQLSGSYEALLNKRAQKLKDIDKSTLNETKIQSLLLEHYTFLKRPVFVHKGELFIGNAKATVAAAKAALDG